jgi:protease IV
MAKFLLGVVTGVVLAGFMTLIFVFALARLASERPPMVPDPAVLVLRLSGEIPERAPVEFPIPLLERQTALTVKDVWELLRKAAADSRIRAVVLEPSGVTAGWAKLEEIRSSLAVFRKSGKPLIAYLRTPKTREYYLATAADRIYMAPQDLLDLKGMRFELMYFRNTLDKLDVKVEIEHAGKYKDFGDTFTRTSMSPETREVLSTVIDSLYGDLIARIAEGRRQPPGKVRETIDRGPFLSSQALAAGLVDTLEFEDQMFGDLDRRLKTTNIKKVSAREYARVPAASVGLAGRHRIAFLVGEGGITHGEEDSTGLSDGGIASLSFIRLLRQVGNDKSIRGVIVRIDSPGGEVYASDEIWREMNVLAQKKPSVISFSDSAASGGYYIAMTGDPIVAYPGTFTGSIGVVFGKATVRGLYNKLGITKDLLTRGRFADIDSDYEPLSNAARAKLREGIDATYADFVAKVATARRRKTQEIEPLAQGRVWLGSQARANGLVDELGGIDKAIELLKKKAGIPAADRVTLVAYPPRRSILDVVFNRAPETTIESRLSRLPGLRHAQLWLQGGLMRLTPYAIEVW